MKDFNKARGVLKAVLPNVCDSQFYSGIEIVSFNKDGKYADEDIGVKVLVNAKKITNKELSIPKFIDGVKIIVEYKIFKSRLFFMNC